MTSESPERVRHTISRYLAGELRQAVLPPGFVPSQVGEVPHVDNWPAVRRQAYIDAAQEVVRQGQVAFAILAAGAASRMDIKQLPAAAQELLRRAGRTTLPHSKALVPVVELAGRVWTYLDLFLVNVARATSAFRAHNPVVLFVSEANRWECHEHLASHRWHGYQPEDVWELVQPLVPAFVAHRADAARAQQHFPPAEFESVLRYSEAHAGELLPERKPAGHGEFLHQLVASGMLWKLWNQGVRYISVRNIDNVAALFDERWLAALGYLHVERADLLVEVSQRPHGQKGGALIRRGQRWQIAEDPSFVGTTYSARDSYYMNNAVAIINLEFFWKLYETSPHEIDCSSTTSNHITRCESIAQRGRQKFPMLIEPKPFRLPTGQLVAAVVPETNMWEATGAEPRLVMLPLAVDSDQDAGPDLLTQPDEEKEQRVLRVRFCPTKTWGDYQDLRKQFITKRLAQRILTDPLTANSH